MGSRDFEYLTELEDSVDSGSGYVAQIMLSSLSGYFTVITGNVTDRDLLSVPKFVSVPDAHLVMVSLRQIGNYKPVMKAHYYYAKLNDPSLNQCKECQHTVWRDTHDVDRFSFARLLKATQLSVQVIACFPIHDCNFQLLFSFFHDELAPQMLPSSLWNCSVDNFSTFQHHLACNLKTECDAGQDETEDCPFSSSECRGSVAFCNRCYKLVITLHDFVSEHNDANYRADQYCSSLGGTLSIPKCLPDWCSHLRRQSKVHSNALMQKWIGFYYGDAVWNLMYTNSLTGKNSFVFHHFIDINHMYLNVFTRDKWCLRLGACRSADLSTCSVNRHFAKRGAWCEMKLNKTEIVFRYLKPISLTNTDSWFLTSQKYTTSCRDGYVTYTFFLYGSSLYSGNSSCHVPNTQPSAHWFSLSSLHPIFTCDDQISTLSFTLVCDFLSDCQDNSDESFCSYPPCRNTFTCSDQQCLSFGKVCDLMPHCFDQSDEANCEVYKTLRLSTRFVSSPALVDFDGSSEFISTPMHSNDSCPDSHYRCPGDYADCLPVYTRCNDMYDCIDHQDEEGCEEITCPGFFKCRASQVCVHRDHLCDGWFYCPLRDDELFCDATCPDACHCQGHSFLCLQPFSASQFPGIRYLDASASGMTLSDISANVNIIHLVLANCSLISLPSVQLLNLRVLDLSHNQLRYVNMTSFSGLDSLKALFLSNNPITELHTDLSTVILQRSLTVIDLSFTKLTLLDTKVFSQFPNVHILNLTFTSIHTISPAGFQYMPGLRELYIDNSPVEQLPNDVFKYLSHLSVIHTDNYKLCCGEILPHYFDNSACYSPKDEISSCEDLLRSWAYRGFLWLVTCLSLTGNIFCLCARFLSKSMVSSSGFSVFVINLLMADFLMGVYIAIIGGADERFRGRYLHYDNAWKNSVTCKMAGFLSLLSSEVSALVVCLITVDRFIVLRFPFSTLRFDRKSASMACLVVWLVGWCLAALPLLPMTSHWEFYSQTGICIPLPVTRQEFKGRSYSFSIFIFLNFTLFLLISTGQAMIYWSIKSNTFKRNTTGVSRDMTIARRLVTVAATDFLCWFPIGMCGLLALTNVPIPGEINVGLAIFILPLNAAINPFVYTFNTWAEKRRKLYETNLVKWLENHPEILFSSVQA